MIEFTQSNDGSIFGYDKNDASQSLALDRIENHGHAAYQFPSVNPLDARESEKLNKRLEIKTERDRRIQTGGFKVGDKWYHSDTFSRTQQMGLVMLGSSIPAGTKWKTMDGSFVDMTQELAQQIFTTAAASDIAIFAAAELHIAAAQASENPSAYDFSSGWPEIFG